MVTFGLVVPRAMLCCAVGLQFGLQNSSLADVASRTERREDDAQGFGLCRALSRASYWHHEATSATAHSHGGGQHCAAQEGLRR